jgi:hypothetical protein
VIIEGPCDETLDVWATFSVVIRDGNGIDLNMIIIEMDLSGQRTHWWECNTGTSVYDYQICYCLCGEVPSDPNKILEVRYQGRYGSASLWCKVRFERGVLPDPPVPRILVAGYMETRLTSAAGGTLTMLALAENVAEVEILHGGAPIGPALTPAGDGLRYTLGPLAIAPGTGPVWLLLGLRGNNNPGCNSGVWPYLTVRP